MSYQMSNPGDEFWRDIEHMFQDEPPQDQLNLSMGVEIQTEPIIGWRVWRVQTRANETYESQTMGSLATLIKLCVDNPIEEVLTEVASDVTLEPWGARTTGWPAFKAIEAVCLQGHYVGDTIEGVAPVEGCSCGVWAYATLQHLRERFGGEEPLEFVVGTVALWGKVIRTTYGYRAQFAYPQELEYISSHKEPTDIDYGVAKAISRKYGVPCVAMRPWRSPDFPRGLRGVTAASAGITIRVPVHPMGLMAEVTGAPVPRPEPPSLFDWFLVSVSWIGMIGMIVGVIAVALGVAGLL